MKNAMRRSLSLLLAVFLVAGMVFPAAATETTSWTVTVNNDSAEVTPQTIDSKVYVPLEPVLKALSYEVVWSSNADTLMAMRNGKAVKATVGQSKVTVEKAEVTVQNPLKVYNGRPYAEADFLKDVFGIVMTVQETTVAITQTVPSFINWYDANNFSTLGTWIREGTYLKGLMNGSTLDEAQKTDDNAEPANLLFNVPVDGTYYLWISGRDFVDNQPGDRYFTASIDDVKSEYTFGNHTVDEADQSNFTGFYWEVGGAFELKAGSHTLKLLDTSRFWARCDGVIITKDADLNPNNVDDLENLVTKYDSSNLTVEETYPKWAKGEMTQTSKTLTIENDDVKVNFYQGEDADGHSWVQNEIRIKDGESWVTVKERTEELGWLMQSALTSTYLGLTSDYGMISSQKVDYDGNEVTVGTSNYFVSGAATWFIPKDVTVTDNVATLTFEATDEVELTAEFALAGTDPKVTLKAKFLKDGAYSFLLYSGDGVDFEAFDRVTAPMLYIKKDMPEDIGLVIPDSWLFTPMSTFTYNEGKTDEFTSGVVMDPSYITVDDQFTYPDETRYGVTFRTQDGSYRNQLVAPMFGGGNCDFKANDTFSVSYRIINRKEGWYDTYKYITEEIYNLTDIRENYYSSLNEAIYNTAEMMMDDVYSGWNENAKGFYNMEGSNLVSQSNPLALVQQYLLTEDEQVLEERTIPSLAYILSRGSAHFAYDETVGGITNDYAGGESPSKLSGTVKYGTNVYSALYKMTQGRVPFFLETALENVNAGNTASGVLSSAALFDIATGADQDQLEEIAKTALIKQANAYLESAYPYQMDTTIVSSFVYQDYVDPVTAFLAAYEATGTKKYLNAAQECAQLLTTSVWTTGYQNDNATENISLNAEDTLARDTNSDISGSDFFYYGDVKWRPGEKWEDNYDAVNDNDSSPKELAKLYPEQVENALTEESVPAWLVAKAGLGTEHVRTAGHANAITMNSYAGTLEKLTQLTGDEYFETMSRSAILGRASTYPGYYLNRNIVYQMKEDWYEDGPDFTNLYWHHIPIYLSILEDYLINSAYVQSNGNIEFPSVTYNGYAYFHTNHYGFESGKFYDQKDMWLWLDEGIITTTDGKTETRNSSDGNEVNIDYIAARKDGVLGLALINEDAQSMTVTVTLGEKVPGGSSYSGSATVYDANGKKSTVSVSAGKFTVTIPAKDMMAVVLNISGVKAPAYATSYAMSNALGETVATHMDEDENVTGKAYVLQMTDDEYFAYVYTTYMSSEDDAENGIDKLSMTYTIGDGTPVTVTDECYPFEFIIKVEDPEAAFTYSLTAYRKDDETKVGEGTLKSLAGSETEAKLTVSSDVTDKFIGIEEAWKGENVKPTKITASGIGCLTVDTVRCVVPNSELETILAGQESPYGLKLYVKLTAKNKSYQDAVLFNYISGIEVRESTTVLLVSSTKGFTPVGGVDIAANWDYAYVIGTGDHSEAEFAAALNETEKTYTVFDGTVTATGVITKEEGIRLVTDIADASFDVATLKDMKIVARMVGKTGTAAEGKTLWLDSTVLKGELNGAGTKWVLSAAFTDEVDDSAHAGEYANQYNIHYVLTESDNPQLDTLEKMKAYLNKKYPNGDADGVIDLTVVNQGAPTKENIRLVVKPVEGLTCDKLVGMKLVLRGYQETTGEVIWMETTVSTTELRQDGNWNLDMPFAGDFVFQDGNYYHDHYTLVAAAAKVSDQTNLKDHLNQKDPLPAAKGYQASIATTNTDVNVGDTVTVTVNVNATGYQNFASAELKFSYDQDVFAFDQVTATKGTPTAKASDGVLKVEDYGESKELGTVYTLTFTAKKAAETTQLKLTGAAFSNQEKAAKDDLVPATISSDTVSVKVTLCHEVTKPEFLTGDAKVENGNDYTFSVQDGNLYDYTMSATVGGETAQIVDNGDGTYTVKNVTGALVITATRTPKTFTVTIKEPDQTDRTESATYMTDYTFTIPSYSGHTVSVEVTYADGTKVPTATSESTLTIAGKDIISNITITVTKTLIPPTTATVKVEGNAASDVTFEATAKPDADYTFTVTRDSKYDYTVGAKNGETELTLTSGADGSYTISKSDFKAGDTITITVNKTVTTTNVDVTDYLTVNEAKVWLILVKTSRMDNGTYTYQDNKMFWSEKYSAYCYLVISKEAPAITTDALAIINETATQVDYGMDVNLSGKVDANDAQLVYNIYNAHYSEFTDDVTMEKFLRADINGDSKINVEDAQAIINHLLG